MSTQTFTSTGTWTAPVGVFSVQAEVWGAGGSGGKSGGGTNVATGAGGGGYAKKITISVTPGNVYTVTVGTGGPGSTGGNGTAGGDSWFSTTGTVYATGGGPGQAAGPGPLAGGIAGAGTIGDTLNSGSPGGAGNYPSPDNRSTAGGNGASPGGGNGGASGAGGLPPGGGGGANTTATSGAGADGQVILTWLTFTLTTSDTQSTSDSIVTHWKRVFTFLDSVASTDIFKYIADRWVSQSKSSSSWTSQNKSQ